MAWFSSLSKSPLNRRFFLKAGLSSVAGLAVYSGEIERHWIEVARRDMYLANLPDGFAGLRIVQVSDIHMDEFTEPFFLEQAIHRINGLAPDVVLLTGDFVSTEPASHDFAVRAGWRCAEMLRGLQCQQVYAVLGNHDVGVDAAQVTEALVANKIQVLSNACLSLDRGGDRIWIAGLADALAGLPDPELAVPAKLRNRPGRAEREPVILMCHEPDYVDDLRKQPAGQAVDLVLSGHTHGGQVRLPFVGPMNLPGMGRNYVQGWFQLGRLQLYVNRGLGTVGLPFRLFCPPEITQLTLRRG